MGDSQRPITTLHTVVRNAEQQPAGVVVTVGTVALPVIVPVSATEITGPASPYSVVPTATNDGADIEAVAESSAVGRPVTVYPH